MNNKDYYEILGLTSEDKKLEQSKFEKTLKSNWKKKCKENHPDRNQDDPKATEKLQRINESYSVLGDPNKRSLYDRFGEDLGKSQGHGQQHHGGFGEDDLSDLINQHFNGGFGRQRQQDPRQSASLRINVSLTLEELFKLEGVDKKFTYKRNLGCSHCNMSGVGPNGKKVKCATCNGLGVINQQMGPGMFMQTTCPSCAGAKYTIDKPCSHCNDGLVQTPETLEVNIPAGSIFNQQIIVPNKGSEIMFNNQKYIGDLIIQIQPTPHKDFEIDQQGNLHIETDVNILDCIIGESIKFKCIDGTEKQFKLKVGTKDKEQFRMGGLGIAQNNTNRTSLYVHINQVLPTTLNQEEVDLIKELKTKENFI